MKITISKSQWESMGKKAGWIKTAQLSQQQAQGQQAQGQPLQPQAQPQQAQAQGQQAQQINSVTQSIVNYLVKDVANSLTDTFSRNKIPLTAEAIKQIQGAVQQLVVRASQLVPTA